ncbi:hypothetical protein F4777DRAFT_566878 [Nemania sp. FL0916]|nr:hypothetical protein F4777DRAFT_566878 [Nemania sp. FL0916]
MVSRLPNLEEFHFEPDTDETTSSQQLPASCATQHDLLAERLGLVDSVPSAIHRNPAFNGKTWGRALAYYRRTQLEFYCRPHLEYSVRYGTHPLRRPDH